MCRRCNLSRVDGRSLMQCSRCKNAYYCSRECQVSDWKQHKSECANERAPGNAKLHTQKETKTSKMDAVTFITNNLTSIMITAVQVCKKYGVAKKGHLVLEIDLKSGENGTLPPALKNPPEYKMAPVRGYYENNRPDEPDWFYKNQIPPSAYENNVNSFIKGLQENLNRMTENDFLCLVRHPANNMGIYRIKVQNQSNERNTEFLSSDHVFNAYKAGMEESNFEVLRDLFPEHEVEMVKNSIQRRKYQ